MMTITIHTTMFSQELVLSKFLSTVFYSSPSASLVFGLITKLSVEDVELLLKLLMLVRISKFSKLLDQLLSRQEEVKLDQVTPCNLSKSK